MKKIIFDKQSADFVLSAFGKKHDSEGYVVESDTGQRVLTRDAQEIKIKKFAGIIKGSELYINDDIASLVSLSDILNKKKS